MALTTSSRKRKSSTSSAALSSSFEPYEKSAALDDSTQLKLPYSDLIDNLLDQNSLFFFDTGFEKVELNSSFSKLGNASTSATGFDSGTTAIKKNPSQTIHQTKQLNQLLKPDEDGDTSLHILIAQEKVSSVMQFLKLMKSYEATSEQYNMQNNNGETYLHVAAAVDMCEALVSLLVFGASLIMTDQRGDTPLHVACIEDKAKFLITAIKVASKIAPDDLKKALDVKNCNGKAVLHLAVAMKNPQVLTVVIEHSISIDIEESITGKTPLILAVELKDDRKVNLLIDKGADVNKATFNGWTPLHYASMFGETKNVKNLLSHNANPSIKTQEKETPKDVAKTAEIKQLLQSKIRKNQRTNKVST